MTDDKFETWIKIEEGSVHFEEYFVKRASKEKVLGVEFVGADNAKPSPKVIDSILDCRNDYYLPQQPHS